MSGIAHVNEGQPVLRPCPNCGREFGDGRGCRFCGQVDGLPIGVQISTAGKRLGAHLLDSLLLIVTLFIGWAIWSLIVWGRGQTPGKQILGMRCVRLRDERRASWGRMFLREFVYKGIVFGVIVTITFGIGAIFYFWLLWDKMNQELWDKMADTIVVDDDKRLLA